MRKASLSLAAALAAAPAIVIAQDDVVTDLGEIIVSGGFTPVEAQKYGRSASVLTSEEIEERGILTVQDALRAVPGISVNGSGDNFTQIRIRGGEGNNTLILIDGVPASAGNDEYILSGLETANIERIEVLRGPQSVFYGSSASSGVINIITKKGAIGRELFGKIEGGDATSVAGRYSMRNERGGLAVGLSHLNDRGYDISGSGGEKDGIERSTINLTGDYLVSEDLQLGFSFRHSEEEYDSDPQNYSAVTVDQSVTDDPTETSERTERLASIFAEYAMLGGRMKHRLSYDYSDFESLSSAGRFSQADRKSVRYLLSFALDSATLEDANQIVNVIAENTQKRSNSNPDYRPDRTSFAVEYRGSFNNGLSVQGGLRRDNNSSFDDDTTWNVGAAYVFGNGVRLHASAGEGSVDPSFFELFGSSSGTVGNPNLAPEKNRSFDLGVEVPFLQGRGLVDVTMFRENLTDEIEWYFDTGLGMNTYRNRTEKAKRRGVEIAGDIKATDDLTFRLAYTYLDASNADGSVEVRRPEHELLLSATHQFMNARGSVNADLRYVTGNYDTQFFGAWPYPVVEMPSYVTVDVAARYDLTDQVTLTGRVTNLFDKEYSDVWGYAKRGRALYVGLESTF